MWKIRVDICEEWFYMWIQADTIEKVGTGERLLDGNRTIKLQGTIDFMIKE